MDGTIVEVANLTKRYAVGGKTIVALDHLSFRVKRGSFVAIQGHSGSGKSTLLHLIGLLAVPQVGQLWIDGVETATLSEAEAAAVRAKKIGFIFQSFHLLAHLTALENVVLPALGDVAAAEQRARALLDQVGLADRADQRPGELSGGEQQRVAVARALINDPVLLLADEPTGNLDAESEQLVLQELQQAHRHGKTVVVASHSEVFLRVADHVLTLQAGRLIDDKEEVTR